MKQKILSILLVLTLTACVALVPCSVTAAENTIEELGVSAGEVTLPGKNIFNFDYNSYSVWSKPVNSYISELSDGSLERLQNDPDGKVLVEQYSSDGKKLKKTITLNTELNYFAGFFCGENNNFLVFADENLKESDSKEILRVVKYSKNWTRVAAAKICGENTSSAVDAGSLRMAEANGILYIHTCHEMYKTSDGLNHQANMTFSIDENNMSVKEKYSGIMNIYSTGYVSHSFNQFVQTDKNYLFRVDHGDAYPRGVSITKAALNDSFTHVDVSIPVDLMNTGVIGNNQTGASVGGFELSDNNCLIAISSVDFTKENISCYGARNIYISVTDKEFKKTNNVKLTNYTEKGNLTALTPQLVKLKNNRFLVMWREENTKTNDSVTKLALINENGQMTESVVTTNMPLSDCLPVLCNDGLVKWYVGDIKTTRLFSVNPENLKNTPSVTAPVLYEEPEIYENVKVEVTKLENIRQGLAVTLSDTSPIGRYLVYFKAAGQKEWSYTFVDKNVLTITGVKSGTLYYVQAQAFDEFGFLNDYSSVKSMTYLSSTDITGLSYNSGNTFYWNKVNGANKYQIAVLKSGDKNYTYYTTNNLSYVDKNVKSNTKYAYQVRAMYQTNGGGTAYGAWSPAKTITTPSISTKPTVSVANYLNGLGVVWSSIPEVQEYNVFYRSKSDNEWSKKTIAGTSCVIENLNSGSLYYVQVQSIGANGVKGNYSSVKTMTYLSRVNINSLVYNGNNTLKWNAVPGANKYQIARLKSGDKSYTYFYTTSPTLTEKNAIGGIAYTYQVRAMYQTSNSGTAYGAWSSTKSVPTLVAPTVTLSNKSNGIRVTWNSIRGAVRYIVYYKKSTDKNWSSAVTTNLYYPILNVQRGALYYVQVRPVGATVSQPYSSVKSIVFR